MVMICEASGIGQNLSLVLVFKGESEELGEVAAQSKSTFVLSPLTEFIEENAI